MAIFHFSRNGVAPARGESAVASSAYMSGREMVSELTGERFRYRHVERVLASGVRLPEGAPERFSDPSVLWNEAEAAHGGGTALVAHRDNMALPVELAGDLDALKRIVEDYTDRTGRACEWAIHKAGESGNVHVHVLEAAMPVGANGFERDEGRSSTKAYLCHDSGGKEHWIPADDWREAKAAGYKKVYNFNDGKRRTMDEAEALGLGTKDRTSKTPVAMTLKVDGDVIVTKIDDEGNERAVSAQEAERDALVARRALWAECVNKALKDHGFAARVSHLSNKDRGMAEMPTKHLGYKAAAIERRAREEAEREGREYRPVTRIGRENEETAVKANTRELCLLAAERAENIYQFAERMERWGVPVEERDRRLFARDEDAPGFEMAVDEVDPSLTRDRLEDRFRANFKDAVREEGRRVIAEREASERERERVQGIKEAYLARIKESARENRKVILSMKGRSMKDIPVWRAPRPPEEIRDDGEVKQAILRYRHASEDLRDRMAGDAPMVKPMQRPGAGGQQQPVQQRAPEHDLGHQAPSHER